MIPRSHPDGSRAQLRELLAIVQAQMDAAAPLPPALTEAFHAFVAALALGPPTAVRPCPVCGELGTVDATRCGHCWSKLVPPPKATPPAPSTD